MAQIRHNQFIIQLKAELKKRGITMNEFCLLTGWSSNRINHRLAKLSVSEYIEACHLLNIEPKLKFEEYKPQLDWKR